MKTREAPYTEPYVRCCERSVNQLRISLLLDYVKDAYTVSVYHVLAVLFVMKYILLYKWAAKDQKKRHPGQGCRFFGFARHGRALTGVSPEHA